MASIRIRNKSGSGGIPSGLTQGELAVNLADAALWVGGTLGNSIFLSGVQSFNGLTGHVWGVTTSTPNTFAELNTFLKGISASGATLGTLVVNSGISASGGVTFHNNVWVGGLLTANGGISAAGGVTFANTVYIGSTLSIAGDLTVVDESGSYAAEFVRSVGTTSDLPSVGKYSGQIYWVRGPTAQSFTENKSGYYYWDDFIVPNGWDGNPAGITAKWVRLTNAKNYNPTDLNQDGAIDGIDLGIILAAWGSQGYSGGNFTLAATNGTQNAFEVKIFGVTTGKKSRPFRITSDVTDPQIYMAGEFVDVDAKLIVTNAPNEPAIEILEGGGYALFPNGLQVSGGATVGGNFTVSGMMSVTGGVSASGATLGTLVVNNGISAGGGITLASPNLTGTPTATTPPVGDNSTRVATTAFVQNEIIADTVTSFNGNTGAVTGASLGANTFTGLNVFNVGVCAGGGSTFSSIYINGYTTSGIITTVGSIENRSTSFINQPIWNIQSLSSNSNFFATQAYPVLDRFDTGTQFSTLYGMVCQPVIRNTQTNNALVGYGLFNSVRRGSSSDFSTSASSGFAGTWSTVGHETGLAETSVSGSLTSALLGNNNFSGTSNTSTVLQMGQNVGSSSTSKGATVGTLYGIRNLDLTVGHISSGKPANVQNWYQIWLGRGITAGLGTIGSNRWAIFQTDPLNGNFFAGGISAAGATFGGQMIMLGGVCAAGGITLSGSVYAGATLTMNSNIQFNSGFGIFGGFVDGGTYN